IAIEHGAEACVVTGIAEVDADDAVIDLTRVAAPLTLHASGMGAGLRMAGVINDADGIGIRMIATDDVPHTLAHPAVVPFGPTEKFLKRASGRTGKVRDRLHALTRQIGELAPDVTGEVAARLGPGKTIGKLVEEISELRT